MKKTLTLLSLGIIILSSSALSATTNFEYTSSRDTYNYNSNMHGFTFNFGSSAIKKVSSTAPEKITDDFVLNSFTYKCRDSSTTTTPLQLFVFDGSNNSIIGTGYTTNTPSNGGFMNFNFSDISGGNLILNSTSNYRFLTVSTDAYNLLMDAVSDETIRYTDFTFSSSVSAASGSSTDSIYNISGGLVVSSIRGNYDTNISNTNSAIIGGANGINTVNHLAPVLTNISISPIPEPSTATLGLLGLGILMMRRRRGA